MNSKVAAAVPARESNDWTTAPVKTRSPWPRIARRSGQVAMLLSFLLASACSSDPCASERIVPVDRDLTPFDDGRSVFSICDRCPELPSLEGGSESGPATGCSVNFTDGSDRAFVLCLYGPGHATSWSGANDAVIDVPSEFEFCEQHCPDEDAFHGCAIRASADGAESIACRYGQSC
jgi:hypothetical protein